MGHKILPAEVKKSLKRKTSRSTRPYNFGIVTKHLELIDSFTKKDYDLYEQYHHKWGSPGRRRQVMLETIIKHGITGPVRQLAELRVQDLYQHQKIIQAIRYRWTDIAKFRQNCINADIEKFWEILSRGVLARCRANSRVACSSWDGTEGKAKLIKFLKKQYQKQNGLCAISGVPLELQIGEHVEHKCSVDRINSDKGYTIKNIQLTTWWVNQMKMDMSMELFIDRIGLIHKTFTHA
jgi:hypothetical protein